jgi:hypothetical protein
MAIDPRKRQKQQERRAAKRKSKQHQLSREKHASIASRLMAAAKYPVLDSCVTEDFWTEGIGWVCLSRELPNGSVAFAVFLVDRYCLGVKNAMADVTGRYTYDTQVVRKMRSDFSSRNLPPEAVRKLVEQAVEYAHSLGLGPHTDYHKAKHIFGDIDASTSTETFEFGKDGKPFFVAGPHDTPERCRRILGTLVGRLGVDGFHFMVPLGEPGEMLPESLQEKELRVSEEDETGAIRDYPGIRFEEDPDGRSA